MMGRAAARRAAELSHYREWPMSAFPPKPAYVRTLVDVSKVPQPDMAPIIFASPEAWQPRARSR